MRIVAQQNNQLYQLYRKDELERLKKKIQAIKNRKPLMNISKDLVLPKINRGSSLSPKRQCEIEQENIRLNKKIISNMHTTPCHKRLKQSNTNRLSTCIQQIDKIYNIKMTKLSKNTSRTNKQKLCLQLNKENIEHKKQQLDVIEKSERKIENNNITTI